MYILLKWLEKISEFRLKKEVQKLRQSSDDLIVLCKPRTTPYDCVCFLEKVEFNEDKNGKPHTKMHVTLYIHDKKEHCISGIVEVPVLGIEKEIQHLWASYARIVILDPLTLLQSHILNNTVDENLILNAIHIKNAFEKYLEKIDFATSYKKNGNIFTAAICQFFEKCPIIEIQKFETMRSAAGFEEIYADLDGVVYTLIDRPEKLIGAQFVDNMVHLSPPEHAVYQRAALMYKLAQ